MFIKRIALSLAALAMAVGIAHAVNITGVDSSNSNRVVAMGFPKLSITDSITAFAGGGQTNAVLLNSAINRVTVVATAADSVKLPLCKSGPAAGVGGGVPAATLGTWLMVINADSADSMNVYPSTGDVINALSPNGAYAMAANKTSIFVCASAGFWYSNLGA